MQTAPALDGIETEASTEREVRLVLGGTKQLRRSHYTLAVDVEEDISLLLHQPSGSVDRVPSDLANLVLDDPASLDPEAAAYFEQRGYLTRLSPRAEERKFLNLVDAIECEHAEAFAAPLFSFVTTYSCNLTCSYCFQSNTGVRSQPERTMTVEAAREFLKVVESAPKHHSRSVVELFGGEPLLPKLRPVVEEIVLNVEKWGYTVRATTNGTGLHAYLDLLGPSRISELQISLDGSRRFHDRRRVGAAGKPTFDVIWSGIVEALARGTRVMIRANLDRRNLEGFVELVEFVEAEGYLDHPLCEIHYVDVQPDPIAPDFGQDVFLPLATIEQYLADASEDHPVLRKIKAPHEIGSFDDWLVSNFHRASTRHCGAVTNNVYFSPDKLVYSCHETAGRPELATGRVEDGQLMFNRTAANWRSRRVDNLPRCRRCPFALTCSGGCAARTDILSEPDQSYCNGFDTKFRSVLKRQYQAALNATPEGR